MAAYPNKKKKREEAEQEEEKRRKKKINSVDPHELLSWVSHLANPGICKQQQQQQVLQKVADSTD